MGLTPATGSEIAMSCVYDAFGFPLPTFNISLNGVLGALRQPPQALGVSAIPASSQTTLSADMGGLTTPDDYVCGNTLLLFTNTASFSGYTTSINACTATTSFNLSIYFTTPTVDWLAASGKTAYTDAGLTTAFNNNNRWYKSDGTSTSVYSIQINTSGVVADVFSCPL
jgi:hypothetical protein